MHAPEKTLKLKYAPIVSVKIKRLFPIKNVFLVLNASLTVEHLKWVLVVMWEQDSDA